MMAQLTDQLLALLPLWGPWLIALVTFGSCLALPVPASLVMLAGGAFVASGDLDLWSLFPAALLGAVCGDRLGYAIGRIVARHLPEPESKRARLMAKALTRLDRNGGWAIFLSRWLFSPLGPYVNFAAGTARYPRHRFWLASVAGESVWVSLYIGLGMVFGTNLSAASDLAGSIIGTIAAATVAIFLGRWLWRSVRRKAPHQVSDAEGMLPEVPVEGLPQVSE
ncbi:DedA family protein [Thioclava sp. GXIMD4216]|uniref:DedA family protein n=1 Tax=Thioclava litoralis TaxID=3076557 RepID=A0ABZ1DZR9_9RHOB|nr:DedA family protein [Thioclava sp. FTW29]